jgi:beta-glucosidase
VGETNPAVNREKRALKGFEKVFLQPKESKSVSISLDSRSFSFFNQESNTWDINSGPFKLEIGFSSRDIKLETIIKFEGKKIKKEEKRNEFWLDPYFQSRKIPSDILNKAYTRKTIDENATLLDAKRVSLNGWIFANLFSKIVVSKLPKDLAGFNKNMIKQILMNAPMRALVGFSNGVLNFEILKGLILIIKGHPLLGIKEMKKMNKTPIPNKLEQYPLQEGGK